ncbi:MAG: hypothetical protein LBS86_02685 [Treponema sp.]|nr:hypothetical protein [Treponema sp.]
MNSACKRIVGATFTAQPVAALRHGRYASTTVAEPVEATCMTVCSVEVDASTAGY